MKYLVTAFPRNPVTQEVFATDGDAAIDLALANPNRWKMPTPSDDKADWTYYAVPFDDAAGPPIYRNPMAPGGAAEQ